MAIGVYCMNVMTHHKLNESYQKAKRIEIDDQTKIVFFSDIHRGDNSMSDEFAPNQNLYYYALSDYLEKGFTYIEIGDGDELWEHPKFSLIRSAHSHIFCLLKEFYLQDRLMLLFGNHNMYLKSPEFVKRNLTYYYDEYYDVDSDLFPGIEVNESLVLIYKPTGQEFLVVHGHQGDLMNDQLWRIDMLSVRYFWRFMHIIGFQNPSSPAKNRIKRHKIEVNFSRWIDKYRIPIICGHTHRPKFPKEGDVYYFNSGCCVHPRGINGLEISDGNIMLIDWRVRPNKDGILMIDKNVIRGPSPLVTINLSLP